MVDARMRYDPEWRSRHEQQGFLENLRSIAMKKSLVAITMVLSGCAAQQQDQVLEGMTQPIDCETAEEDIRTLENEKVHLAGRLAAGVTTVAPIGLVVGDKGDTQDTKMLVAAGDYNEMIDRRIAEIKQTCSL